jgi:hypothetical protein
MVHGTIDQDLTFMEELSSYRQSKFSCMKVYHEDTSVKRPVFYSHVNIKPFSLPL